MIHIELHTLDTADDALTASSVDLIEITEEEFCENCDEPVAFDVDGTWIPCTVLLTEIDDEEIVYLLCDQCTESTLAPLDLTD